MLGVLDPYVLLTFKGIKQRGDRPAQERGSQKLPGVLDPYVLLTFKGTQQRGALPAQGRGSQKLLGMLDPREEPCQPRREAPRSCWGCWILTSSLFLKEFRREKPCQPRGEAPRSCRGCWILTSSLLLKELNREEPPGPASPGERLPEAPGDAGSLRPPYF